MAQAEALARAALRRAALVLMLVPAMAQALSSDRNQPITIEADRATINEKQGSSIYEGNVHLQQGTLNLRGDSMKVQMSGNELDEIVLTGQPASFQQRPEGRDSDQHAEAGRIEYHAMEQRMILLENARVWQSGAEEFRSERIIYNMKNNTVSAGGTSGDRVRITLQPKSRKDSSTPASPATESEPAAPAAGSEPAAPASGSEPAAPASGSESAAPAAGSEPAAPAAAPEPAAPATAPEPAAPATPAEPAVPAP